MTGFVTDSFGSYGDSVDQVSRNSLPVVWVTNNTTLSNDGTTNGTTTFKITVCELLIISPLTFDKHWHRRPGFTMINNIIINMSVDNAALQRI
jgi:hypothetical protein